MTLKLLVSRRPCSELSKVSGFIEGAALGLTYLLEESFLLLFCASSLIPQQEMAIITVTNLTILQQLL